MASYSYKDMMQLKESVPSVYDEFRDGNFVVQKSPHIFSTIAIDQAHEQMNEHIKGDGGVIGITNNPSALIQWITAGPEIARIIDEFENSCDTSATSSSSTKHHDQGPIFQLQFVKHVKAMVATFEELGNPFCEDSQDLIALDTKEVLGGSSVTSLKTIESTGKTQYEKYVAERLQDRSVPVSDIIPKNNLPLFKTTSKAKVPKISQQVKTLKSNCELFSRMYISCQSRNGDMDDFFKHENQAAPPSLSDMGELRQCTKSDLLTCFEKLLETVPKELPEVDANILDGSVIVNMLPPKGCSTFGDYSEQVFIPYLMNTSRTTKRLDVVWDRYIKGSLKSAARHKRGSGSRLIVKGSTPVPKNWQSFLRVDQNKTELYYYLSECIRSHSTGSEHEMYSTQDLNVVSSNRNVMEPDLAPCNHEEADTRLILHALNCGETGLRKVCIRTVDTDVVVLAISKYHGLSLDEIWIAFGVKRHYRIIPVHTIVSIIGAYTSQGLLFFHAFTGCDTVSSFSGIGKKTAWDTWLSYPEITETFKSLSSGPVLVFDENVCQLQRFVILLYDRTSECTEVDKARKVMFARGRQLDRIPPTKAALTQHIKRAAYQAGFCWDQSLVCIQKLPNPNNWGWMKNSNNQWTPFWTTLSEAAKACKELIKCGCRKACVFSVQVFSCFIAMH